MTRQQSSDAFDAIVPSVPVQIVVPAAAPATATEGKLVPVPQRDELARLVAAEQAEQDARLAERQHKGRDVRRQAMRSWAAMAGWDALDSQADWEQLREQAEEDWEDGTALLELLGGRRYLEPGRAALLLMLWDAFVTTYRPQGPAESMVIAMAVLGFDHFLRINTLVGNLEMRLEDDFFGLLPLTTHGGTGKLDRVGGGLTVWDVTQQIAQEALPLLDRMNRLVIRNLRALRELKGAGPALTLQNYGQVNLATMQHNAAELAPAAATANLSHQGTRKQGTSRRGRRP